MATNMAGSPPYATWGDVPGGEQSLLEGLRNAYEALVGYVATGMTNDWLLAAANRGDMQTLADFGRVAAGALTANMPWADYGLTKDEYISASSIYGTEYKKVTGTDISPEALTAAFKNPRDPTGGLLSGSQYQQQLMNDAAIQKNYGWVKYGLDFAAWTQTKLSMRGAMGRDINDAEAATILQYNKAATGATAAATARAPQQQAPAAVGGSVVR
jgi:hypothetical protein